MKHMKLLFVPKDFVELSHKALIPLKVIEKYCELKEMKFIPLEVV